MLLATRWLLAVAGLTELTKVCGGVVGCLVNPHLINFPQGANPVFVKARLIP